jgi:hypothetical protein
MRTEKYGAEGAIPATDKSRPLLDDVDVRLINQVKRLRTLTETLSHFADALVGTEGPQGASGRLNGAAFDLTDAVTSLENQIGRLENIV